MKSPIIDDQRALFYERFASEFDAAMNRYEVTKRLRLVFDDALSDLDLSGRAFLDAGCGTGLFSQIACERGAAVTSMDVGEGLLERVAEKCESQRVVGDTMALPFDDESFDVVLSTEVIEHTLEPRTAVRELARVLKPGGRLVLSTPNKLWHPSIRLAEILRLRPYHGYENWVRWNDLRAWIEAERVGLVAYRGFNALPFVHPATYRLIDKLDRAGTGSAGKLMINIMAVGQKRS